MNISELKNSHRGDDIWVLAAGRSMDWVDPAFFGGKLTVAVNDVEKRYPASFVVRLDHPVHPPVCVSTKLVLPHRNNGVIGYDALEFSGPCWRFDHLDNRAEIDSAALMHVGSPNFLVVGQTTTLSAMHLAAHLGAANIILCGVDGGTLDEELTYSGYYHPGEIPSWYGGFVKKTMGQIRLLRNRLRAVYGCRVYSLNPFLGLTTDDHRFKAAE